MLVKTLISIAEKLNMDIDNLTINSLRLKDGYTLNDSKKTYDIVFSKLALMKGPSLPEDYDETIKITGAIIDLETQHELDLLNFLITNRII